MSNDDHFKFVKHELRNALGPLVNYIEILKMQSAEPGTIALIGRQVARMQAVIDQLLRGKARCLTSPPIPILRREHTSAAAVHTCHRKAGEAVGPDRDKRLITSACRRP